jgi:hypothetical protein
MEFCAKGDLATWLYNQSHAKLSERINQGKDMALQCAEGLAYIHSQELIHGYKIGKKYSYSGLEQSNPRLDRDRD